MERYRSILYANNDIIGFGEEIRQRAETLTPLMRPIRGSPIYENLEYNTSTDRGGKSLLK
jgi:hypothetical protein